jgi:myo-inositol-1(or 4)-monophosphatase
MNPEPWLADICELATQASGLALQRFREGSRRIEKGPGDWASAADLEIEQLIRKRLHQIAPGTLVHGEETGQTGASASGFVWHVDPIDGSANFLRGIPHFATVISLTERDSTGAERILMGVTSDPCRGELFVATASQATTLNGIAVGVSEISKGLQALLAVVTPKPNSAHCDHFDAWFSRQLRCFGGVRRSGAMALDLAWVACGRLDAFGGIDLAPWDIRAGLLQITQSGGVVQPNIPIRSFPNRPPTAMCLVANSDSLIKLLIGDDNGQSD